MKDFFKSIFGLLFTIIIIWGEFGGLYHTFTRHRDQFWGAVFVPPISWYRGVEMFWHKEYSGKRWEKRKLNDMGMLLYIVNSSFSEDENKVKLNEEIEGFSKRISKYPKSNKESIKAVFDDYVQYQLGLYDDISETVKQYINSGTLKRIKSEKTKEAESKLIQYGLQEYLDLANKANDQLFSSLQNKKDESGWLELHEKADEFEALINLKKESILMATRNLSKNIFE